MKIPTKTWNQTQPLYSFYAAMVMRRAMASASGVALAGLEPVNSMPSTTKRLMHGDVESATQLEG